MSAPATPSRVTIRPVIMSGGAGTRLWPLSRRAAPKQFHALGVDSTLIVDTMRRVSGEGYAAPMVLANRDHRELVRQALSDAGATASLVLLEPEPRNTAPAIAAAAAAADPDDILVVLPADHVIRNSGAFAAALLSGARAAAAGAIVTFGLRPTAPETGFGYIKAGSRKDDGAYDVAAFVEKPDLETAKAYLAAGDYFWNAGIFMFRAKTMLDEMERLCPQTLAGAREAVATGARDGAFLTLGSAPFARTTAQSIDYEIMEKTDRAAVMPIVVDWSDIGSWAALWEISDKDAQGNAAAGGETVLVDTRNCLALSTGPAVALVGVEDLVVVAMPDGVIVLPKSRAQDVKKVVEELKRRGRGDLL